eukprot:scaffold918_cov126-Cylindrotheca_fusiformis.AAC.40
MPTILWVGKPRLGQELDPYYYKAATFSLLLHILLKSMVVFRTSCRFLVIPRLETRPHHSRHSSRKTSEHEVTGAV